MLFWFLGWFYADLIDVVGFSWQIQLCNLFSSSWSKNRRMLQVSWQHDEMSFNSSTHDISKYIATFSSSCSFCPSAGCYISCWQQKNQPQCPESDEFFSELVFADSFNFYLDLALKQLRNMNMICWMIPQFWKLSDLKKEIVLLPLPLGFILFLPLAFGNRSNINQKENYQCFCQSSMASVAGEMVTQIWGEELSKALRAIFSFPDSRLL